MTRRPQWFGALTVLLLAVLGILWARGQGLGVLRYRLVTFDNAGTRTVYRVSWWDADRREGPWRVYDDGQLWIERHYESGVLDGVETEWSREGLIRRQCLYEKGRVTERRTKPPWIEDR